MKSYSFPILIIYCFLAVPTNFSSNTIQKKNGWETMNLNGDVESISKRTYHYKTSDIDKEGVKGEWNRDIDGFLFKSGIIKDYDIEFDQNGNLINHKIYQSELLLTNSPLHIYEYNESNDILKVFHIYDDASKDEVKPQSIYEYNTNGQLSKIEKRTGHNIFAYDKKGNVEIKFFNDKQGKPVHRTQYTYDDAGNKLSEVKSRYSRRKADWAKGTRKEYVYNDNNDLIEYTAYLKDGRHSGTYKYTYDEYGNILTDSKYIEDPHSGDIRLAIVVTFKYEYDMHQNWIKCVAFRSKFDTALVERDIVYRE